jgi:hypothetical protein
MAGPGAREDGSGGITMKAGSSGTLARAATSRSQCRRHELIAPGPVSGTVRVLRASAAGAEAGLDDGRQLRSGTACAAGWAWSLRGGFARTGCPCPGRSRFRQLAWRAEAEVLRSTVLFAVPLRTGASVAAPCCVVLVSAGQRWSTCRGVVTEVVFASSGTGVRGVAGGWLGAASGAGCRGGRDERGHGRARGSCARGGWGYWPRRFPGRVRPALRCGAGGFAGGGAVGYGAGWSRRCRAGPAGVSGGRRGGERACPGGAGFLRPGSGGVVADG